MRIDKDQLSSEIKRAYRQERNSLVREMKPDLSDRIEVEIGDTKQDEFFPQVKLKRWDNEVNFSLRWQDDDPTPADVRSQGKTIKYRKGKKEAHFYDLPAGEGMEDGGFEFEVVFSEKPDTNVVNFSIQTKELDFFYQPPLTQAEIEQGAERPANVVGSYAVYHKSKRDNRVGGKAYKTGKAFHIYRPKATDAAGHETWAELSIDKEQGNLSVTVPQSFLDSAVYPVIVDPTIGNTSIGASSIGYIGDRFLSVAGTASADGSLESVSVYLARDTSSFYRIGVYDNSSGNPSNLIGGSDQSQLSTTKQWRTHPVAGSVVTGVQYHVAVHSDRPETNYDSGTGKLASLTYSGAAMPNPAPAVGAGAGFYSIYATYTTGGGSTNVEVTPGAQSIPVTSPSVTATGQRQVTTAASVQTLTSASPAVSVSASRNVTTALDTQQISVTGPSVEVATGTSTTIATDAQAISVSSPGVTIDTTRAVEVMPTAQPITTVSPATQIGGGASVAAQVQGSTVSSPTITVTTTQSVTVATEAQAISIGNPEATVSGQGSETVLTAAGALTTGNPSVTVQAERFTTAETASQGVSVHSPPVSVSAIRQTTVQAEAGFIAIASPIATGHGSTRVQTQSDAMTTASPTASVRIHAPIDLVASSLAAVSPAAVVRLSTSVSVNAASIEVTSPAAAILLFTERYRSAGSRFSSAALPRYRRR